ncbi:MAG: c-type cytochrome [Candidatus Zixiibacteriota bacterium]
MRKVLALLVVLCVAFAFLYARAQKEEKEVPKVDPIAELQKSIERGKALFSDTSLGTSGMTCNSCHMEGGTKEGKMGDMTLAAFDDLGTKYPKYFEMAKRVMTLDQVVTFCIVNPLKGKAPAWDDQKLTDLTAYVASVKAKKKEKEK